MDISLNGGINDQRGYYRVDSIHTVTGTPTTTNGLTTIAETGTTAKVGDVFRAETGPLAQQELRVVAVTANSFTIASAVAPAAGNTFYLLRPVTARTNPDGTLIASVSSGSTAFDKNGSSVTVNQDTTTPANSRPLPVANYNNAGQPVNPSSSDLQTTGNASLVTIATNTTGAATSAKQDTGNTSLASILANTPAPGQGTTANSSPVVLPASQITALTPPTTVTVTQATGTNLHTVVDSSALPTGAATETTLAAMSAKIPALGQAAMIGSQPVVIASNQTTLPVATVDVSTTAAITAVNANLATGTPTAGSVITLGGLVGLSTATVEITTAGTATLAAYISSDGGTTRVLVPVHNVSSVGAAAATSLSAATLSEYKFDITGANTIYIFCTAFTSTTTATLRATARSSVVNVSGGSIAVTGTVTATQAAATAKTPKSAIISVGTAAIRATTDGAAVTAGRVLLRVRALDANTGSIFIGSSTVTAGAGAASATAGMLVYPGEAMDFIMDAGDYYLIASAAGQLCYLLEQE